MSGNEMKDEIGFPGAKEDDEGKPVFVQMGLSLHQVHFFEISP